MKLVYDVAGSSDNPSVLLLHGLSGNRRTYDRVVPALADDYHVFSADLRGHGETAHADSYGFVDYTADVAEFVRDVIGGPVVAVGHSLGGVISSELALHYPDLVRGIFLEDPPLFEGDAEVRATSPAAAHFTAFVKLIRGWQDSGASEETVAAALGAQPMPDGGTRADRSNPAHLLGGARGLLRLDPTTIDSVINGETWVGLDPTIPVACPVTVLRADPTVGAVFTAENETSYLAAVPHAEVFMAPGQAHGIHEDAAGLELYLGYLKPFLAENS